MSHRLWWWWWFQLSTPSAFGLTCGYSLSTYLYVFLFLHGRLLPELLSVGRLRTCPRHPKLHTMYNPPLHIIAFFYSQLTSWYCFSKRVLRMKSTAFFVYGRWVNIFFHSITPNGFFRCSSFHSLTAFKNTSRVLGLSTGHKPWFTTIPPSSFNVIHGHLKHPVIWNRPSFLNFEKLYKDNHASWKYKCGMKLIVFTYSFHGISINTQER